MTVVFMRFHGQSSATVFVSSSEDPETAALDCYRSVMGDSATVEELRDDDQDHLSYVTVPAIVGSFATVGHLL